MDHPIEMPLFPLKVVLYPGTPLGLHIFEPRYKAMIAKCMETEGEFGILLINDNQLCNVGCTTKIVQMDDQKTYDDGGFDIQTEGFQRFQVLEFLQREEYLEASIEYFDDDPDDVSDTLLSRVLKLFQEMVKLQTRGVGVVKGIFDPKQFSFLIASLTDIGLEEKQTLLELTSTTERLRKLEEALNRLIPQLKKIDSLERAASRNGHIRYEEEK